MVTIEDVAKEAQVSIATVSRVLNNSFTVTQETKEKVLEAIEKTGYQASRRVKSSQENLQRENIIIIISSILPTELCEELKHSAICLDYKPIFFYYTNEKDFDALKSILLNFKFSMAGIILINTVNTSTEFQNLLMPFPLVQIGQPIMMKHDNFVVFNDEINMARDAVNYLVSKGKKRIGFITYMDSGISLQSCKRREEGYLLGLLQHELPIDKSYIVRTDTTVSGGYQATKKLLAIHPDVDAILCSIDVLAQGALGATSHVPQQLDPIQDIAIMCLDYSELWDLPTQHLPYINPNFQEIGSKSIQLLHNIIQGNITSEQYWIIRHTLCP